MAQRQRQLLQGVVEGRRSRPARRPGPRAIAAPAPSGEPASPSPSRLPGHRRSFASSADSARSRSSTEPSFSMTCSARAAFSAWAQLARLALVDQGVAARRGPLAAHLVGGDDGDGRVEGRLASPTRTAAAPRSRRPRSPPAATTSQPRGPLADQRMDLLLEPGQLLGVGEDDLADPAAVDARRRRRSPAPSARPAARAAVRIRAARGRPRRWRASPRRGARRPPAPRTSRRRCRR